MARVLIVWELGSGYGHIVPLSPIADKLSAQGHEVIIATKDVASTRLVLQDRPVRLVQAPISSCGDENSIRTAMSFAHILHNSGFDDVYRLTAVADSWRVLFDLVQPDLILFEHSPTALLAARTEGAKHVVIGTGFTLPPDEQPLPNLRPWRRVEANQLFADESRVLDTMNGAIKTLGGKRLDHVTSLYYDVDSVMLLTFKELDHYPNRPSTTYHGAWNQFGREEPLWPPGAGGRIFAYLKPFRTLPTLIELIQRRGWSTIIHCVGLERTVARNFESQNLRIETRPVDIVRAAQECDVAILNGTHGTTAQFLLAGKPILQLPIYLEQVLLSMAVIRTGAAVGARHRQPETFETCLDRVLTDASVAAAATECARRYADFDPLMAINNVVNSIDQLIN